MNLKLKHRIEKKFHDDFGFVYGNGLLHHVDIQPSLRETWKVLKPKGKAIFIEPLAHNFFINVYRKMADKVRTPTEAPLQYGALNNFNQLRFGNFSHQEFQFFTLLIFGWFFMVERVHPNKQRYWKKIIDEGERVSKAFIFLNHLDGFVLKKISLLRRYCWNTVLIFEK